MHTPSSSPSIHSDSYSDSDSDPNSHYQFQFEFQFPYCDLNRISISISNLTNNRSINNNLMGDRAVIGRITHRSGRK